MSLGFAVSIFGILQYLTSNGRLYWVRRMRVSRVTLFGPYVNRNHFAGFVEFVVPFALVPLALGMVRRQRMMLVGLFALVPIVALFLSASRGGLSVLPSRWPYSAECCAIRKTGAKFVLAGGLVVLLSVLAVTWIGVGPVLQRFASYKSLDVTEGNGRRCGTMRGRFFWIILSWELGLVRCRWSFPAYETLYDGRVVNHAHDDYVETSGRNWHTRGDLFGLVCRDAIS